jgi:hypothetical protein
MMQLITQPENSAYEAQYLYDRCEVKVWKDGTVTITSPGAPVITFRRAPNAWCGRD